MAHLAAPKTVSGSGLSDRTTQDGLTTFTLHSNLAVPLEESVKLRGKPGEVENLNVLSI